MTSNQIIALINQLINESRDRALDKNVSHLERVAELDKIIAYQELIKEIKRREALGDKYNG